MTTQKRIIASNRLPVSVSKTADGLSFSASSGGLATAMSSLGAGGDEVIWIGWPGISADELSPSEKRQVTLELRKRGCIPVYLTTEQIEKFYQGYANDTLWPLFHYFQLYAVHRGDYWQAYQEVNSVFSRVIARHCDDSTTVWVQDYHLMLLPALLRAARPSLTIGFFLHIPFPSFEIFRALPERKEVLLGLLGADLIGFHIYDYARHFLSSCLHLLAASSKHGVIRHGNRLVRVDAFPIGIDYEKFQRCLSEPAAITEAAHLREHYGTRKIILSVDRLDYSKGILERLEAYDQFLTRFPRFHGKVVLVMVAVPSRTEVETYQNLRDNVEQAVSRINGTYGTIDWIPISYQFQNFPFEHIAALYSEADVVLVTPLRDGMNLVAKEYVASKQKRPGVLILSEMAGAIDELPEALSVNPHDTGAIVGAIKTALTMPVREQRSRMASMQKRLASYTVTRWSNDFLHQLADAHEAQTKRSDKFVTAATAASITTAYQAANHRLLLLDYDGTLRPFTSSHRLQDARPSAELLHLLKSLASRPNTTVCIVSGRDKPTLEKWFGGLPVWLVAEHGAWIKTGADWSSAGVSFADEKQRLLPLLRQYVDRTAGALLEEKEYSLVWHYRDVPTELAYTRTADLKHDLQALISDTTGVFDGNKVVEVKLRDITKGSAATKLLARQPADFILAIGDDFTDEDMFQALPAEATTICVGDSDTAARYQVAGVRQVLDLLRTLL